MHSFKVYNSVVSSIFTKLFNQYHYLIPVPLHHPEKKLECLAVTPQPNTPSTTDNLYLTHCTKLLCITWYIIQNILYVYELDYIGYFIQMELCIVWPFVSGFFLLA